MSITRLFQAVDLQVGNEVILDEKARHYIGHVLRSKVGGQLLLFNGLPHEGVFGDFKGEITIINKKQIIIKLVAFVPKDTESSLSIHLAQGIPKGEKMDFIIQKSVELGVKKIIPLLTARCTTRFNKAREANRMAHWQAVLVHACEQSGRQVLPTLVSPQSFDAWIKTELPTMRYVLSPSATNNLNSQKKLQKKEIVILIGPEGGLTEVEIATATVKGFELISLGPRILRTETASLAAISIFQFLQGDI